MNLNPEFQRNLWLEITRHRLIMTPLVLGALFFLMTLLNDGNLNALRDFAVMLFCVFALWGTYLAGDAVVAEIKHRTWDIQRMSAIGPWSMTWGKLLGSSIFPWLGGLLCLLVAVLAGDGLELTTLLMLVLTALFAQAVALLASLLVIMKRQAFDRSAALAHLFAAVVVTGPFWGMMKGRKPFEWFGQPFLPSEFALMSVIVWGFWVVMGCYRQMSAELRVANPPVAWVGFLIFAWTYFAGFVPRSISEPGALWSARLLVGFCLVLMFVYATMLADRHDPAAMHRLLGFARQRNWPEVLRGVPLWLPTLALAVLLAGALAVLFLTAPSLAQLDLKEMTGVVKGLGGFAWLGAILLFTFRDLAIILYFQLGVRSSRSELAALLYLGILYGLIPGFLVALKQKLALAAFFPWISMNMLISLLAGAVQAAIAIYLVKRRWQTGFGVPQAGG